MSYHAWLKKHRLWRRRFVGRSLASGIPRDRINHALMVREVLRAVDRYHGRQSFNEALKRFYGPMLMQLLTRRNRLFDYLKGAK